MPVRIALLVCDTLMDEVAALHGQLPAIFDRWLRAAAPAPPTDFTLDAFDAVAEQFPDLAKYDALIITGSSAHMCSNVC